MWWRKRGALEFRGLKLSHDSAVCASFKQLHKVEITNIDKLLLDDPGRVGSGGNSGFQALNLALQFGAMRVLLIGYDMHAGGGVHWHGPHTGGLTNPRDTNFLKWRKAFEGAAELIRKLGVDVVNTSMDSALTVFPKMTVEDAMRRWSLQ